MYQAEEDRHPATGPKKKSIGENKSADSKRRVGEAGRRGSCIVNLQVYTVQRKYGTVVYCTGDLLTMVSW